MIPEKVNLHLVLMNESEALLDAMEQHPCWPEACNYNPNLEDGMKRGRLAIAYAREAYRVFGQHDLGDEGYDDLANAVIPTAQKCLETYRRVLRDLDDRQVSRPRQLN